MKRIALLLSLLSLTLSPALAEAPSRESVIKLLEVTNISEVIESMQTQMDTVFTGMLNQAFSRESLSPEKKEIVMDLAKEVSKQYKEELSWGKVRETYVQIYSEIYTQLEVDAQIEFYESEVGQSVVSKNSSLTEKSMAAMQQRVAPVMQNLQKTVQDVINRAKEK